MTTPRPRFVSRDLRAVLFAAGLVAPLLGQGPAARADDQCNPPCGPGQVCYQGICMVPAPATAPVTAPAATPTGPTAAEPAVASPADSPAAMDLPSPAAGAAGSPPQQPAPGPVPPATGYGYPPPPPPYGPPRPVYGAPPPALYAPPPPPYPARSYGYRRASYRSRYGYPPRRLFLATPYLGISSFRGETADLGHRSVGARAGAILGFRLHPAFSLNGELSLDVLNFRDVPSGQKMDGGAFAFSASPLFHLFAPTVELVFGPRVGVWAEGITRRVNDLETTFSANGFLLGLNGGLFFPVRRCLSVGGLVTLDMRLFSRTCTKNADGSKICSEDNVPRALTNLTFNFAVMF